MVFKEKIIFPPWLHAILTGQLFIKSLSGRILQEKKQNKQTTTTKKLYENHDYLNSTVYLKVTRITLSINQNLNNLNFFTGITDWTFF